MLDVMGFGETPSKDGQDLLPDCNSINTSKVKKVSEIILSLSSVKCTKYHGSAFFKELERTEIQLAKTGQGR